MERPPAPKPPAWKPGDPLPALTPAQKAEDAALMEFVRGKHRELMAHLKSKFPNDQRTQKAEVLFAGFQEMTREDSLRRTSPDPDQARIQIQAGGYQVKTGLLRLLPRRPPARPVARAEILLFYLHELAHCMNTLNPGPAHGPSWRSILLWLLRVASEPPLSWEVAISCDQCGIYRLCSAADCARCTFRPCPPAGPTARPIEELEPATPRPDFSTYNHPPATYERVCTRRPAPAAPWRTRVCETIRARLAKTGDAYRRACVPRPAPVAAASCAKLKALGYAKFAPAPPPPGLPRSRLVSRETAGAHTVVYLNALLLHN